MNYKHLLWLLAPCALIGYCTMPCLTERCKAQEAWYAQNTAWREEYNRRNVIQPGDRYPQNYDYQKYAMIKIANRYLMWPKEYGSDRAIYFFWPSRSPALINPPPKEGGITVFFTDMYPYEDFRPVEYYKKLISAKKNGDVLDWVSIREGLEKVRLKDGVGVYYIATQHKDYQGYPPVIMCSKSSPKDTDVNSLSSYSDDVWFGIKITFRFSWRYCQDWPEIYQHGMSIIKNNVKEALL